MQCQLLGRKRYFKSVVEHADLLTDLQNILNINSQEEQKDTTIMTSIALGYKGVALSMMKQWTEAYPCLLTSYELNHQTVHCKHALNVKHSVTKF